MDNEEKIYNEGSFSIPFNILQIETIPPLNALDQMLLSLIIFWYNNGHSINKTTIELSEIFNTSESSIKRSLQKLTKFNLIICKTMAKTINGTVKKTRIIEPYSKEIISKIEQSKQNQFSQN